MCMSCGKSKVNISNSSQKVHTSNKGIRKTYASASNSPFGKPKVRISFANRKT